MDTIKQQIRDLTPEDWQTLLAWVVNDERARRDAQPAVEEAQAQLVEELWDAKPELRPEVGTTDITPADTEEALVAQVKQWEQPTTPLDGYQRSELAALGGRVWRNHRPGNTKKPGSPFSGWEDVTADYLKLADALDGNEEGAGQDAPGLITEPKPEPKPEQPITPANEVPEWQPGERVETGDTRTYNGHLYVATDGHKTSDMYRPDKGKKWMLLS